MHTKCDKHQHDKKHTTSIVLTRGRAECLHGGPPSDVVHLALVLAPHQGQLRGLEPRLLLLRLPGLLQRALLEDLHVLLFDEDVRGQLPKHGCLSCSSRPLLATDGFLCNWRRAVTFLVHSRIVERVSRTCSTSFVSWGFFTNEAAGTGLAVMPRGH